MRKSIRFIAWSLVSGNAADVLCKTGNNRPGPEAAVIEGVQWYLVEVAGSPDISHGKYKQPHIMWILPKNSHRFSGCNNFFGSYELTGHILICPLGTSRMAFPDIKRILKLIFKALDRTRSDGKHRTENYFS